MRHLLVVTFILCGGVSLAEQAIAQTSAPVQWHATGSGMHYQVQGSGNPADAHGAMVALRAEQAEPGKYGASAAALDAAPYRGHTVRLSADLNTRDAQGKGATIWLRADGSGRHLAFANSQWMPVVGTVSAAHREIQIDVPPSAERLLLGTALEGGGEVVAIKLRLAIIAQSASDRVAPAAVLDAAIQIVRTHALRRRDVDWSRVEPDIRAMAKDAKQPADVYPAIRTLLAALGDHHSFLLVPSLAHQEMVGGGATSAATVRLNQDGIGYIDMPGYRGMDPAARRAFVERLIGAIGKNATQARCGWVVDLRQNTGGSMLPMLASLRPLLGGQPLGSFRDADGHQFPFRADSHLDLDLPKGPDLQHARVAVLTGPHTASSGEIVAVAFRGRPDTRSFGQPTSGHSSGNATYRLPDGSVIALTTSIDVDRDGQVYGGKLLPDEEVTESSDSDHDATLAAATSWLVRSSTCAH